MAEVRDRQVFRQRARAGGRLSGAHRTGRYGTQRKPFYLTLTGSGSLEETAPVSNPEESGKEGLLKK